MARPVSALSASTLNNCRRRTRRSGRPADVRGWGSVHQSESTRGSSQVVWSPTVRDQDRDREHLRIAPRRYSA
jgi:hypothetical protein